MDWLQGPPGTAVVVVVVVVVEVEVGGTVTEVGGTEVGGTEVVVEEEVGGGGAVVFGELLLNTEHPDIASAVTPQATSARARRA